MEKNRENMERLIFTLTYGLISGSKFNNRLLCINFICDEYYSAF